MKYAKLPVPLRILKFISRMLLFILIIGFIQVALDKDVFESSGGVTGVIEMLAILLFSGLIYFFLDRYEKRKAEDAVNSREYTQAQEQISSAIQNIFAEFEVPKDAANVDLLAFAYEIDGNKFPSYCRAKGWHENFNLKMYAKNEMLYIVSLNEKFAFPLEEMKTIHTVKADTHLPTWNKSLSYESQEFKQFGVREVEEELYTKGYHILELVHDGEVWGIYFPNYELPVFERLTRLKAQ